MKYLIVENGIITNCIVADEVFAATIGAMPDYRGAAIGKPYDPPTTEKLQAELERVSAAAGDTAELSASLLYEVDKLKLGVTV